MSALRWGILGPGGIARQQTSDLQSVGIDVVAVGSRDLGRARAFAADFGIPRAYGSYEQLVADPALDVVYVASPQNAHHEHALLALRAGKHVLLEKPFTLNGAQARELAETARAHDRVLMEAMWTRYLPTMVRLREVLASGVIGDVRTVIADHTQQLSVDGHRVTDPALGGGALLDLGIYPVAFAWDVLGAPASVIAHGTAGPTGVDEQTSMLFGYDSGAHAVLTTGMGAIGSTRASLHGTRGRIEVERMFFDWVGFRVVDADGTVLEHVEPPADRVGRGMQFQALELERVIQAGESESPIQPLDQTVAIMETLDEVRRQTGLRFPGE